MTGQITFTSISCIFSDFVRESCTLSCLVWDHLTYVLESTLEVMHLMMAFVVLKKAADDPGMSSRVDDDAVAVAAAAASQLLPVSILT